MPHVPLAHVIHHHHKAGGTKPIPVPIEPAKGVKASEVFIHAWAFFQKDKKQQPIQAEVMDENGKVIPKEGVFLSKVPSKKTEGKTLYYKPSPDLIGLHHIVIVSTRPRQPQDGEISHTTFVVKVTERAARKGGQSGGKR
jgi:hypothetical protein